MVTSADRNDLMPGQEKLEWVTPKISLMEAEDTDGKRMQLTEVTTFRRTGFGYLTNPNGPS
jgi:hypothetical protein